jgi:ABC-type transport system involved in cytochrome bd biosynthesis fused ATPase/permease subunit
MEDNQAKESLYIPQGLKKKMEYFSGYGRAEFVKTIIVTLITAILCVLLFIIKVNAVIVVLTFLIIPSTTVIVLTKNDSNISVVDQVKFMVRFQREQKKYKYIYQDELKWK